MELPWRVNPCCYQLPRELAWVKICSSVWALRTPVTRFHTARNLHSRWQRLSSHGCGNWGQNNASEESKWVRFSTWDFQEPLLVSCTHALRADYAVRSPKRGMGRECTEGTIQKIGSAATYVHEKRFRIIALGCHFYNLRVRKMGRNQIRTVYSNEENETQPWMFDS